MSEPLVQSITSQLIVRLRDRILAGAYPPGSALRQDTLASEFGTSKIPVREALVQLQSEGLVTIYPNRGFQVRPLVISELEEVFSLRLQIEPAAAGIGASDTESGEADHTLILAMVPSGAQSRTRQDVPRGLVRAGANRVGLVIEDGRSIQHPRA